METVILEGSDPDLELIWPELQRVARPARERRRLAPSVFTALVKDLCERAPLSVKELAALLNRSEAYVGDAIRPLVGEGTLSFLYPDQPKHPGQRYVAGAMAAAAEAARTEGDEGDQATASADASVGDASEASPAATSAASDDVLSDAFPDAPSEAGPGAVPGPSRAERSTPARPAEAPEDTAGAPHREDRADDIQLDALEEEGPELGPSTIVPATPLHRRAPPPALFEPTHQVASLDDPDNDEDEESRTAAEGELLFVAETPPFPAAARGTAPSKAPEHIPGRLLTARQNLALALAVGVLLGLTAPPAWGAWGVAAALVMAAAHIGLHSVQFESFRRQRAARGTESGGPQWVLFLILKTGFTGAEITLAAALTRVLLTLR